MTNSQGLKGLFTLTAERLRESLEDFSPEELLARPQGLAPVLWQVGHVAFSEARFLERAGRPVPVPEGYEALFAMGSSGDGPFPGLEEVRAFFDEVNGQMAELAGGDPNQPVPSPRGAYRTAGEGLSFMLYHRGYHHGKIMTLRSLMGKRRLLG